jgi:hypothetical protein
LSNDEVPGVSVAIELVSDELICPDECVTPDCAEEPLLDDSMSGGSPTPEDPEKSTMEERLLSAPETLLDESEQLHSIPTTQQHAAYTPEESMCIRTSFEPQT